MSQPKQDKKPIYRRRWFQILLVILLLFIFFVGPWPANWSHYQGSDYAEATFKRLQEFSLESFATQIYAAVATVDITPPVAEPMAGYGARNPMESEGIYAKIYAKAITLSNQEQTVTLVAADILLMTPQLRAKILQKTQLPPEAVYFTASHSHSGPGGYESGVYQLVLGKYQEKILDRMADLFAQVILQSRENLQPISVVNQRLTEVQKNHPFIKNRVDSESPVYDSVFVTNIYQKDQLLANLVVASAHATCVGRHNRQICGDYPGFLQQKVEQTHQCKCFFLAGAVGSMSAKSRGKEFERAENVAEQLFQTVSPTILESQQKQQKVALKTGLITVDLPSQHYPLGSYFRVSPWLMATVHNRQTYIQVLRLDNFVFLAMPCDYSGELAMALEQQTAQSPYIPVITSFNGDYIGYLVSRKRYDTAHYETRTMNFFGPWCGEYFNEIAHRIVFANGE